MSEAIQVSGLCIGIFLLRSEKFGFWWDENSILNQQL